MIDLKWMRGGPYAWMAGISVWALGAVHAWAQTTTIDPAAPLDLLKQARTKAASSNLNVTTITTAGGNGAVMIAVIAAVLGLGLAAVSGHKLYKASQDENSRESVGRSVAGVVVGALVTIISIVVGLVVYFVTGAAN